MTKRRAGGPREHGKLDKPRGAFRLAADLDAAGALGVADAVERVIADMERQELTGRVSRLTLHKMAPALRRFGAFAAVYGAETLADVDGDLCQRWCTAAKSKGRSPSLAGHGERASIASSNARKVMLHAFFTTCQAIGLTDRDPSVSVDLPPRTTRGYRPLTEAEAGRCRKVAHQRFSETLLPAGTGLALRGVTTAEMAAIRVQDCYPQSGRVWAHGGGVRTAPRWVALDRYAVDAVTARIAYHAARVAPQDLPGTLLLYKPKNPDAPGQKRQGATCMQLARVLNWRVSPVMSRSGPGRSSSTPRQSCSPSPGTCLTSLLPWGCPPSTRSPMPCSTTGGPSMRSPARPGSTPRTRPCPTPV